MKRQYFVIGFWDGFRGIMQKKLKLAGDRKFESFRFPGFLTTTMSKS